MDGIRQTLCAEAGTAAKGPPAVNVVGGQEVRKLAMHSCALALAKPPPSGLQVLQPRQRARPPQTCKFLEFSESTAFSSRSVAEAVNSGAMKNCAKRSRAPSKLSAETTK